MVTDCNMVQYSVSYCQTVRLSLYLTLSCPSVSPICIYLSVCLFVRVCQSYNLCAYFCMRLCLRFCLSVFPSVLLLVFVSATPYSPIAYRLYLESREQPYHGSSRTSPHALSLSMLLVTHLIRKPSPVVSLKVLFSAHFCSFFTPPHSAN